MALPPRIDFPNAVYHVTTRGNGRTVIFWTDDDRQRSLGPLARSDWHNILPIVDTLASRLQDKRSRRN
jgi:hypothetical protein